MSTPFLLLLTAGSIATLLVLIMGLKMQAFVALLLVSMGVAIIGGIPLPEVASLIQEGMGSTLGYIAIIIGLGTMIGEILQVSGGAQRIANTLLRVGGEAKAPWALCAIGLIVAIPVFFEVALILFIPLVYNLARRTGKSLLCYGIPLVAGIAVAHAFIPPTPGPVAVALLLGADLGWVIFIGLIAGIPAAVVAGVGWGKFICARIHAVVPECIVEGMANRAQSEPPLLTSGLVLSIILVLPLFLLLIAVAWFCLLVKPPSVQFMAFAGHPFSAVLASLILALYFLGTRRGFSRTEIQQVATRSMDSGG